MQCFSVLTSSLTLLVLVLSSCRRSASMSPVERLIAHLEAMRVLEVLLLGWRSLAVAEQAMSVCATATGCRRSFQKPPFGRCPADAAAASACLRVVSHSHSHAEWSAAVPTLLSQLIAFALGA